VRLDLRQRELALASHQEGGRALAQPGVGHGDDGGLDDAGVVQQEAAQNYSLLGFAVVGIILIFVAWSPDRQEG